MRNGSRRKMSPNRLLAKHFPDLGGLIGNRPERRQAALRQSSMLSSRLSVEALEPRLLLSADVPPVGVSDQIGRATCRVRGWRAVEIDGDAESLKKKQNT